MIYVTVGKMPLGFARLVKAADELALGLGEEVFIQTGRCGYAPVNAPHTEFLTFPEAEDMLAKASLVISHAGIGTIIGALRAGTPIVVMPRLEKYGEHFTDHQLEITGALAGRPGVAVVNDAEELKAAVGRLLGAKGTFSPARRGEGIIAAIEEFLEGAMDKK